MSPAHLAQSAAGAFYSASIHRIDNYRSGIQTAQFTRVKNSLARDDKGGGTQADRKRPPSTRIEIQDSVWWSHWLISATSNAAGS
ncbi:hypothetical protein RCH06_001777, partial [Polaromonas sp. CG_9.5]|uniref:hypothetical protein n=1 Tax=Polaromonas sp. CG_9.5 TaxID=3071705 RepID=UPI002E02467B|nr:hypothetical protein [Polaromonas sp. CG_9.5]